MTEALRLAEILEGGSDQFSAEAAAELRRQHSRIKELDATIATLNKALAMTSAGNKKLEAALDVALEALERVENDLTYHGVVNGDALDADIAKLKEVRRDA